MVPSIDSNSYGESDEIALNLEQCNSGHAVVPSIDSNSYGEFDEIALTWNNETVVIKWCLA